MFVIASNVNGDWATVESSNIVSEVHAERQCSLSYQNLMYTVHTNLEFF